MGYRYAAGMNSIICYDETSHELCQRMEEVPVEITGLYWNGDEVVLQGQYAPVGFPEGAAFFAKPVGSKYIFSSEQADGKILFQMSAPRKRGGERKIGFFIEYLHTEIQLKCVIHDSVKSEYLTKKVKEVRGDIIIWESKPLKAYAKGAYRRARKWAKGK